MAGFVDLHRDFDVAELDEADPYDAQLAPAHQGGFRFTLFGEWMLQPAAAGAHATEAQAIEVEVRDARGQHRLQIDALPWSIGRSAAAWRRGRCWSRRARRASGRRRRSGSPPPAPRAPAARGTAGRSTGAGKARPGSCRRAP